MSAQAVRLTSIDIDNALKNAHLQTVFQPIVCLDSREVLRHEVFVRWDHPGLGPLPPGAFISFFEAQGRIGELTRYVLREAMAAYQSNDDSTGGISINLSPADLRDPELPGSIRAALVDAGLEPQDLTLECPGILPDTPVEAQLENYRRLAETECPLALEVRSRTTNAFADLDPFPFTEIKTGGSHILRHARSSRGGPGLAAVAELVGFAKDRNIRTVAVGIEDEATAKALAVIGFDAGQGRALGRVQNFGDAETSSSETVPADTDITEGDESTASAPIDSEPKGGASLATDDVERMRARQAAAKRVATRRFHAAKNARQLQWRLETSLSEIADGPEPVSEAEVTAPATKPTQTDGVEAPASEAPAPVSPRKPTSGNVSAILGELPSDVIVRARMTPNLSLDLADTDAPTPETDKKITVQRSDVAENDGEEADATVTDEVTFVVAESKPLITMPRFLTRKYRITHFWPRSWKRAYRRWAQARETQSA